MIALRLIAELSSPSRGRIKGYLQRQMLEKGFPSVLIPPHLGMGYAVDDIERIS